MNGLVFFRFVLREKTQQCLSLPLATVFGLPNQHSGEFSNSVMLNCYFSVTQNFMLLLVEQLAFQLILDLSIPPAQCFFLMSSKTKQEIL